MSARRWAHRWAHFGHTHMASQDVLMPDFNFVPSGEPVRTKPELELCLVSSAASIKVAIGSKKVAPQEVVLLGKRAL